MIKIVIFCCFVPFQSIGNDGGSILLKNGDEIKLANLSFTFIVE